MTTDTRQPAWTVADVEAAADIAQSLYDRAAELPPDSQIRALAMRDAGRWTKIGRRGIRRLRPRRKAVASR